MKNHEILLVYDRQCPACDYFCRMVRIRESVGELRLIDARGDSAVMDEITRMGLDIDQGMVLKMDDALYYGADAIHALALIGTRSGVFNRLNHWIFRSKGRARVFYPPLRFLRNLLLKLLARTKINNLGIAGNDRF